MAVTRASVALLTVAWRSCYCCSTMGSAAGIPLRDLLEEMGLRSGWRRCGMLPATFCNHTARTHYSERRAVGLQRHNHRHPHDARRALKKINRAHRMGISSARTSTRRVSRGGHRALRRRFCAAGVLAACGAPRRLRSALTLAISNLFPLFFWFDIKGGTSWFWRACYLVIIAGEYRITGMMLT